MSSPRGDQINVIGPSLLMRDKTNVIQGLGKNDGPIGEFEDELELPMSDKELLSLADAWTIEYEGYFGKIKQRQETNRQYAYGRQNAMKNALKSAPIPDNILFEARETFLAAAFARNPDPLVWSDNTDMGNAASAQLKTMLAFLAEQTLLREKLKMAVRHWDIYLIGVLKHGWDSNLHEIVSDVRDPRNIMLDPNGFVDEYCDFTGWVGEKITRPAGVLIDMFPEKEQLIYELVKGRLGTRCSWVEWWNDDYTFSTFRGHVLGKSRNPNFNYPKTIPDEEGKMTKKVLKEGRNHFVMPKKPYSFFEVYGIQEQPHDETTLLEQNIKNQDYIVERTEQLARGLKKSNNSIIFSLAAGYTEQTAKQAADAMEEGSPALSPVNPNEAVARFPAPPIPAEFFNELEMRTNNLRNIYGTLGITAQGDTKDERVGTMVLNEQHSQDRIGGMFGDKIELFAASTFNHWVQLMHVYYEDNHTGAMMGKLQAVEEATLSLEALDRRFVVKSAPNSMNPKDSLSEAKQALSLWEQQVPVDPKTILQLLDIPDIENTLKGGLLFKMNPQQYIIETMPDLAMKLGLIQQPVAPGQPVPSPLSPQPPVAAPAQPVA